jgi:5,6,7,8-tetrahydromethanopterin hydro-lyase
VYRNNRVATCTALRNGASGVPIVADVLAGRDAISNPFYAPSATVPVA